MLSGRDVPQTKWAGKKRKRKRNEKKKVNRGGEKTTVRQYGSSLRNQGK